MGYLFAEDSSTKDETTQLTPLANVYALRENPNLPKV